MTDQYPRVASLSYQINSSETHKFAPEADTEGKLTSFRFHLRGSEAAFFPTTHFASADEALSVLDPQLRAWELDVAFTEGLDVMTFKFIHAHVEKSPPEPGVTTVPFVARLMIGGLAPRVIVTHSMHPLPPTGFAVDDCVKTLGALFSFAKRTPIALLYVAYSMTTCVELYHGPRLSEAAKALGFSSNVLDRVNQLATTRSIGAVARKFEVGEKRQPLSNDERVWLEVILELIVRRAAAVAAGVPPGEQVTLSSHPLDMS